MINRAVSSSLQPAAQSSLHAPATVTLAQTAADELQEQILTGRLAAGTPLRLEETARALGMSPSPVREALRELERLGLVVQVPHRGARVAELTLEDLRDTYAVRILLETRAVELATAAMTAATIERAEATLARYHAALEASAMREAREAHAAFHFTLYEASGSPWLVRLIQPVWQSSERYRFMAVGTVDELQRREGEHRGLLAACAAGDVSRAGELLAAHLERSVEEVSARMDHR